METRLPVVIAALALFTIAACFLWGVDAKLTQIETAREITKARYCATPHALKPVCEEKKQ
jgi:hypothetical protein